MALLTKSKYLLGLQCPKYLWMAFHEKDKFPEVDDFTQHMFDQGHLVGELAKELFPNGINIPQDDFMKNIYKTKDLLKERKPLFEAGFMIDNLFSRADVLNPVNKDEWDIIEVKSGTQVKKENVHDVSFQKYIYEKVGLKIRKCFLMHINNQYVKQGDINTKKLFTLTDITPEVGGLVKDIGLKIKEMKDIISGTNPDMTIGRHCTNPYNCPLEKECWGFLPENHVFNLYRGGSKSEELLGNGVISIYDIPKDFKLSEKQQIQYDCERLKKPFIDKEKIKEFLGKLEYPLYYLDFETFNPAVPVYDGMRPYQRVPFQFSLHVVQEEGSTKHYEYLGGKEDPREEFLSSLKKVIGDKGSIVVYNESFEKSVLKELSVSFPNDWVDNVLGRVVDLIVPFRSFHYYNPKQKGSASIKKVLPALVGKSYSDLGISGGGDASVSFFNLIFKNGKSKIREDLLKYCKLDTEGMVWIVKELRKLLN